jgi:hypothetical protein
VDTRSSDSGGLSRRRGSRVVLLTVLVLLVLGIGILIGRSLEPDRAAPRVVAPSASPRITEGSDVINGVAVGYDRSEDGAVAAATTFAGVMSGPSGDVGAYRAAMGTLAAPDWKARADELASNAISFLRSRYGDGGSISFQPIRYKVDHYSDDAATVQLWGVVVATGPKVQRLEESWITGTIRLSWIQDDWRVSGQDSKAGPTPRLLAGQDATPADELNDFQGYGRAPQP